MEANQLMMGDWVLMDLNYSEEEPMYTHPEYRPYKIQNGEDIDLACETNCIGDADVYQPIPLTPEIFKKNGFFEEIVTNADSNDDYTAYHWNPTPQYPSDGLWFYPTFSGYAFDYIMSKIKIKYVHELQHLLRLCGIDKEITL